MDFAEWLGYIDGVSPDVELVSLLADDTGDDWPRVNADPDLPSELHFALVVDRPPEPVFTAADRNQHFIEVPMIAWSRPRAADIRRNRRPELQELRRTVS